MAEKKQNLWERHQNKKAKAKKERAKARHFGKEEEPMEFGLEETSEHARIGIVASVRGKTIMVIEDDQYFECGLAVGVHPNLAKQLVVGDRVSFEQSEEKSGTIQNREERKSVIARMRGDSTRYSDASIMKHVIAANVDKAVIVAAAKDPEFHPRFIDRYLVVLQNGNVEPVICLNKSDLTDDRHPVLKFYKELGIPIVETSATDGKGIEDLKDQIRGVITVLVGNSGVGKSSLANVIMPDANIRASDVSQKSRKGRHTTTSTNLYKWDEGSYIVDTPGIRSLGIENIDKNSLRFFFPEFEEFADSCKFRDCLHDHEPECGVKKAVEEDKINRYRYDSYLRMLHE